VKKRCLILGSNGFVGARLYDRLSKLNNVKRCDLSEKDSYSYFTADLRHSAEARYVFSKSDRFHEVYQCAATVGGVGFYGNGKHDADILRDSILINANVLNAILEEGEPYPKVFFASSATVYPGDKEGAMSEDMAYPVNPSSEYGWEKIMSERLYLAHHRNYGIPIRIARFHNIFGAPCVYDGGRETSIASFCRMIARAPNGGSIKIWGDGSARRSYIHIDDCVSGVMALMEGDTVGPVNIGSDLSVSIRDICEIIISSSGKEIKIEQADGPAGAKNRNSDNALAYSGLNWRPEFTLQGLKDKLAETYKWIERQVQNED
jgi:nucleoside-diphosphate-sugar epimerase